MGKTAARKSSGAAAATGGGSKKVWVVKSDNAENEKDGEEDEVITSPLVKEKNPGPIYTKEELVKMMQIVGKVETDGFKYSTQDRPVEESEEAAQTARRSNRQKQLDKKAEKAAKRAAEAAAEGQPEAADASGGGEGEASQSPDEGGVDAQDGTGSQMMPLNSMMDPALMQYLQLMTYNPYGGYAYQPPGGTTVMLRNIPNRYTRDRLVERLAEKKFGGSYDFIYLPIDFNSKCNVGYAFINFRTPADCQRFFEEFHNVKTQKVLPGFSSQKVCQVSYARVQGRDANLENLRDEKFMEKLVEKPEWQPLFFDDAGKELDFKELVNTGSGNSTAAAGGQKRRSSARLEMQQIAQMQQMQAAAMAGYMMPTAAAAAGGGGKGKGGKGGQQPGSGMLKQMLPSAANNTLLSLRNIPTQLTSKQISESLNKNYLGQYDFIFAPKSNQKDENRGHVFVNFKSSKKAQAFMKAFNDGEKVAIFGEPEAAPPAPEAADPADAEGGGGATGSAEKTLEATAAKVGTVDGSLNQFNSLLKKGGDAKGFCPLLVSAKGEASDFPVQEALAGSQQQQMQDLATAQYQAYAAMYGYGGYPYGYYGGGYGGYNQASLTANASINVFKAQQMAATHQAQRNAAQTGKGGGKGKGKMKEKDALAQVEYYFSQDNLCKDTYLRGHFDDDGWVALSLILSFSRMSGCTADMAVKALSSSTVVELNEAKDKLRLKEESMRKQYSSLKVAGSDTPAPAASPEASS